MSLALDVALYLRDNQGKIKISPGERGVLFTLSFRIGSRSYTWVSQKSLSKELQISERNLIRYLSSLKKLKLIQQNKNSSDKRKNLYRAHKRLVNYHQTREDLIEKVIHNEVINKAADDKKYMTDPSPISEEYMTDLSPIISETTLIYTANIERKPSRETPKATYRSKQHKDTRESARNSFDTKKKIISYETSSKFEMIRKELGARDRKYAWEFYVANNLEEQADSILKYVQSNQINREFMRPFLYQKAWISRPQPKLHIVPDQKDVAQDDVDDLRRRNRENCRKVIEDNNLKEPKVIHVKGKQY